MVPAELGFCSRRSIGATTIYVKINFCLMPRLEVTLPIENGELVFSYREKPQVLVVATKRKD